MFEKAQFEVRIRNWRGSEFKQSAAVRDLAEATGLHRNTINNLEVGRYAGDPATLQKIEKVLVGSGRRIHRRKRRRSRRAPVQAPATEEAKIIILEGSKGAGAGGWKARQPRRLARPNCACNKPLTIASALKVICKTKPISILTQRQDCPCVCAAVPTPSRFKLAMRSLCSDKLLVNFFLNTNWAGARRHATFVLG